jgi:hypothetical protein
MTEHTRSAGSVRRAKRWVGPVRPGPTSRAVSVGGDALAGLLAGIGGKLAIRGLAVSDVRYNGELLELDVTNPGNLDKGKVNIGNDGYLIWERWGPINGNVAGTIVDIVVNLLACGLGEQSVGDDR